MILRFDVKYVENVSVAKSISRITFYGNENGEKFGIWQLFNTVLIWLFAGTPEKHLIDATFARKHSQGEHQSIYTNDNLLKRHMSYSVSSSTECSDDSMKILVLFNIKHWIAPVFLLNGQISEEGSE